MPARLTRFPMLLFAAQRPEREEPEEPVGGTADSTGSPSAHDLPSYPGQAGPREQRRAAERERRRQVEEDEFGLPTYPRSRSEPRRHSVMDRLLVLVLALGAVILIAYAVTRADDEPPPDDLLAQAVYAEAQAEMNLATGSPSRVRQFVRDEFGWAVGVPIFPGVELMGVGIATLAPTIEVPAFFYQDQRGRQVIVYRVNYALLDQVPERVRLSRADYDRLAEDPAPRARRIAGRNVLLWRDRADIFVVVTELPPDAVALNVRVSR